MAADSTLSLFLPRLYSLARRLPRLERIVARADPLAIPPGGLSGLLCRRCGLEPGPDGEWPVAALTALADGVPGAGPFWLRADPVHLLADQTHLVLLPPEQLSLAPEEADRLITDLDAALGGEGWHLARGRSPLRWYLSLAQPPGVRTTPLEQVAGGAIDGRLPEGERGAQWRRALTEMQMLLHRHPVNLRREEQGRAPVNALWLWGGGRLPPAPATAPPRLGGDGPLVSGLAAWSGAAPLTLPELTPGKGALLWLEEPAAPETLAALEKLLARHRGEVELLTDRGGFAYRRWHRLRFWRHPGPLADSGGDG